MSVKIASVLCAWLLGASAASASTISVTAQDGGAFGQERHRSVVRLHADTAPVVDERWVYAGLFRLSGNNGFGDFMAFCVEITQYLSLPSEYTSTQSLFGGETLEKMELLFSTSAGVVNDGEGDDSIDAAAFQVALWDIIYDDATSVTDSSGSFSISGNSTVAARANGFLDSLDGATRTVSSLSFLQSGTSQNLVLLATMPLPASSALLLAGFGGFAALRRKRRG